MTDNIEIKLDQVDTMAHFGVVRDWTITLKTGQKIMLDAAVVKEIVNHELKDIGEKLEGLRKEINNLLQIGFRSASETEWQACKQEIKWEDGYCKDRDCIDCTSTQVLSLIKEKVIEGE